MSRVFICPECRRPPGAWSLDPDTLTCSNSACLRVYPKPHEQIPVVVDGDFEPFLNTDVIGDLEPFDALPKKIGSLDVGGAVWDELFRSTMYVVSHYTERPNPFTQICDELLPVIDRPIDSAVDLGCGVGGVTLEVAHQTGAQVVGLDSNLTALRWAELASRGGAMSVPVRVTPRSYEMREVQPPVSERPIDVEWVCGNVLNPPLQAESYDLVMLVNLLDSVSHPYLALGQASALLREGGHLILAQPDAWMSHGTPPERWLAEDSPGWDEVLAEVGLRTLKRVDSIDWVLHRTERMRFGYSMHARVAIREEWTV